MESPSIKEIVEQILLFSKFGGCDFDDSFIKSIYLLILDEMDLTEHQYRGVMRIYRNFGIKSWHRRLSRIDPSKRESTIVDNVYVSTNDYWDSLPDKSPRF